MLISTAYAQGAPGGSDLLINFLPLILIVIVFYFLLLRPQQKRMKEHRDMLANLRRGDRIVSNGGLMGTITKVDDDDDALTVEIADGVRVKMARAMIAEMRGKGEPVSDNKRKGKGSNKAKAADKDSDDSDDKPGDDAEAADTKGANDEGPIQRG